MDHARLPTAYVSVNAAPSSHLAQVARLALTELPPPRHRAKPVQSGHHVTIRYLGPSTPAQLETIHQACRKAQDEVAPFNLRLSRFASHFPHNQDHRNSWIWAGVAGDTQALHTARNIIDQAATDAGYPQPMFPLNPHVTIVAIRSQPGALHEIPRACRNMGVSILPLEWTVTEINLILKLASKEEIPYRCRKG